MEEMIAVLKRSYVTKADNSVLLDNMGHGFYSSHIGNMGKSFDSNNDE